MTQYELLDLLKDLREDNQEDVPLHIDSASHEVPKDLWKTLSAFANTPGGGVIILGIDPRKDFSITGVRSAVDMKDSILSLCSQMCPRLDPLIQVFQLDNRDVIAIEVGEALPGQKPCYYRGQGYYNGSYIRSGNEDRPLSPYEIQSISESSSQPKYDAEPLSGTSVKDLDPSLLRSFLERMRARPGTPFGDWNNEKILEASRVLVRDRHGKLAVSLAGWLSFAPYPQGLFPSLCITLLRFPTPVAGEPGPDGERFLDNVKIEGPLPQLVVHSMKAVKRNMHRRDVVQGLFREEHWEYPEEAIREGIVNAIGHRDYSPQARVSQIQILMFPDRLEFVSPGGIYGPIIPDQLGEAGIQSSRNETMMNILENLPPLGENRSLCENRGSGLAAVMVSCRKEKLSPPGFRVDLSRFRMVISNRTLFDAQTLEWLDNVARGRTVTESQRYALAHLKHVGWINNADYCRLTGVDSRVATRELGDMVNSGFLDRLGSSRWSIYQLSSGYINRQQLLF
ncbi:MAG: putative DNA binding domain-containing protein [Synergistales bacterium]|nr:putative DNA binding domain-containing protein [Synergistales bacterium]